MNAIGLVGALAGLWIGAAPPADPSVRLPVPIVRQSPERCGPAALTMVLRYLGAPDSSVAHAGEAYSPALRGTLLTDLGAAAHRAGYDARIATLDADSLRDFLRAGVPPIVLFQAGPGPLTRPHYAVVTGWDAGRGAFVLHDGSATPRLRAERDLVRRWRTAGSRALVVARRP